MLFGKAPLGGVLATAEGGRGLNAGKGVAALLLIGLKLRSSFVSPVEEGSFRLVGVRPWSLAFFFAGAASVLKSLLQSTLP